MSTANTQFAAFADRMRAEGLPEIAIQTFGHYYRQLVDGQTGMIPESDITPVDTLPDADNLPEAELLERTGRTALSQTILLKLNGGLGTSMGLQKAKSLLPVKNGLTFLDIIARQAMHAGVPLVLMNSFATRADSLAALEAYPALKHKGLPLDFQQHKIPKVAQADFSPVHWPANPDLTWCPPGHGDIYTALVTSGMLNQLRQAGYRYAFVSNSDNLGAILDPTILGYFASQNLPFMMEVADRTEADKKGGHLARRADGQLILRESAQCPDEDEAAFQNVSRHRYFNTNNLWLNLDALAEQLAVHNNILGLPMIRNAKTVDPRDDDSTPVYQVETAMGSAIGVFPGAAALRVPRQRFAPVKKTNDLLLIRSDAYHISDDFRLLPNPARDLPLPAIALDANYKFVTALDEAFPGGIPSLARCTSLSLAGKFVLDAEVRLQGQVQLVNRRETTVALPAGQTLSGDVVFE